MRSLFFEGLVYLDLLEVYGSSRLVGSICHLAQSNVYRGAMALSSSLDLALTKQGGSYQCQRNADVVGRLREASQLLRARGSQPLRMVCDYRSPLLKKPVAESLWTLPQTWLGSRSSLQALDKGLLDLLILRSGELLPILGLEPARCVVGQTISTPTYTLLPLNTESVQVYAHPDHPLHLRTALTPADLLSHASPAFAEQQFPGLRDRYLRHGLWTQRITGRPMQPGFWEQLALEDGLLVPSTPNAVSAVTPQHPGQLAPIHYTTGLVDHDVLVLPTPLLDEPIVQQAIRLIAASYNLVLPQPRHLRGLSHAQIQPDRCRTPA